MESVPGAAEVEWTSYRVIVTNGKLIKVDICRMMGGGNKFELGVK